jgi:hypothetical protein
VKLNLQFTEKEYDMSSFYGATTLKPTKKQIKDREKKVAKAIEYLGDKYLLAKPVEKING